MGHLCIVVVASMFVLGLPVGQGKDLAAELATAEASWRAQKARSYEFTIGVGCFCPPSPPPTFRVTDGQPAPVGDVPADVLRRYADYNTIEKLFAELRAVAETGPDKMVVTYDAKLGHPILADVDPRKGALDEQFSFNVTNVKILERGR